MARLLLTWIALVAIAARAASSAAAPSAAHPTAAPAPPTGEPSGEFLATLDDFSHKLVRTSDAAAAERLRLEAEYDPRIAEYLRIHGEPELLFVVDRWRVRLLYLRFDTMVSFVRRSEERRAEVKPVARIPARFEQKLRLDELSLVRGVRAA